MAGPLVPHDPAGIVMLNQSGQVHWQRSAAGAKAGRRGVEGSREFTKGVRPSQEVVQTFDGVLHSAARSSPLRSE